MSEDFVKNFKKSEVRSSAGMALTTRSKKESMFFKKNKDKKLKHGSI